MLILIVDSDAKRRVGLSFMLSKRGHTLQAAANPTNAIWILRQSQEPPRLILLDPGCEGENAEQLLSVVAETAPAAKVFRLLSPVCA
jgi:DNA-binding NtrC family response regulator